jgi:hypothetical protein
MTLTKKALGAALLFLGVWFLYDKLYIIKALVQHKIGVDITKLFFPIVLILVGIYLLLSKSKIKTNN